MAISANKIADYFLKLSDEEEAISNLKLQKLLYYAQGFYAALYNGTRLFPDQIRAWAHGPVVPEVYRRFKEHGANGIPRPKDFDLREIDEDTSLLLEEIWRAYGQFSAWRLREMTHQEPPWQKTPQNEEITIENLEAYFRTRIQA